MRSPKRTFAATVLSFEAVVVFFAGLVAMQLTDSSRAVALGVPAALAVACILVAGLLRRPWGYAAGWLLQIAIIATGVLVPAMYAVGAIFAALWLIGIRLGIRIEHERAMVAREQARGRGPEGREHPADRPPADRPHEQARDQGSA